MKIIKNNIWAIICSALIVGVFFNLDKISDKLANNLVTQPVILNNQGNNYQKKYDFAYVQNISNFMPYGYNDILNIYYTLTNLGIESFTFSCPSEYKNCLKDIETISDDKEILTYINYFVSPFNSFENIETEIDPTSNQINIKISYLYSKDEIKKINAKVQEIAKEVVKTNASDYDNIKAIHDYIINNTKYDVERNTSKNSPYMSYKASGPLLEGYATCNGYTDAMAIFLDYLNIKNFKIATELMQEDVSGHVWNAVYLDNTWYHLDLTWDDPVSESGTDYLQHKYFLITTSELEEADKGNVEVKEHIFNKSIYPEMQKQL